jgi:hypothetical protein
MVRGVIFVIFFVKEEDGFGCRVLDACVKGGLNREIDTSCMDCCSVMHSFKKMYFCC